MKTPSATAHKKTTKVIVFVWALKSKHGYLFAHGCHIAPWIFTTRDRARKAAKEAIAAKIQCVPARIKLMVVVEEGA